MTLPSELETDFQMTEVLRMHAVATGIVVGFTAGLVLFLATNWLVIKGGVVVGPHLLLLSQYFIGYQVTFVGSLVGFGYAFVCGFIVTYSVARLYNWLVGIGERRQSRA